MPKQRAMIHVRKSWLPHVLIGIILIIICSLLGYAIKTALHAVTPTASLETEIGSINGATKLTDNSASGAGAIKFGSKDTSTTLLSSNLDNLTPASPMSLADYRTAMGSNTVAAQSTLINTSLVAVNGRGNVIRQTLKAQEYGGSAGIVVLPPLAQSVDEASIQYDIRFDSSFDWSWGGKLPGLGGATTGTNPGIAAGCNTADGNAWSGRGMWITPGSYGSVTGSNEWIGYMYNYNKASTCGDNIRTAKAFTAGSWHTVKQYYKLNTPGAANGIHRMWLDGTLIVNSTNFQYRNSSALQINYLFWSIFRGGNTIDWAGSHDDTIDIDNLLITTP